MAQAGRGRPSVFCGICKGADVFGARLTILGQPLGHSSLKGSEDSDRK